MVMKALLKSPVAEITSDWQNFPFPPREFRGISRGNPNLDLRSQGYKILYL